MKEYYFKEIFLRIAARTPPLEIGRFTGHAKPTTTLGIYAHLFEDNNTDAMAALGTLAARSRPTPEMLCRCGVK